MKRRRRRRRRRDIRPGHRVEQEPQISRVSALLSSVTRQIYHNHKHEEQQAFKSSIPPGPRPPELRSAVFGSQSELRIAPTDGFTPRRTADLRQPPLHLSFPLRRQEGAAKQEVARSRMAAAASQDARSSVHVFMICCSTSN